jgi:hypothetical protein
MRFKHKKEGVIIEAVQWDGWNVKEIMQFCPIVTSENNSLFIPSYGQIINTDFVIKNDAGGFSLCKENDFWQTYERIK